MGANRGRLFRVGPALSRLILEERLEWGRPPDPPGQGEGSRFLAARILERSATRCARTLSAPNWRRALPSPRSGSGASTISRSSRRSTRSGRRRDPSLVLLAYVARVSSSGLIPADPRGPRLRRGRSHLNPRAGRRPSAADALARGRSPTVWPRSGFRSRPAWSRTGFSAAVTGGCAVRGSHLTSSPLEGRGGIVRQLGDSSSSPPSGSMRSRTSAQSPLSISTQRAA